MAAVQMMVPETKEEEVYHGAICLEKLYNLLDEFSIPRCLFYFEGEILEFGFNRSTGFYWIKQKSKTERKINKVGTSFYDKEISGIIQHRRITKISGVKGKELLVSLTLSEMHVGVPSDDKVKFVSIAGISRVHPIAAFEVATQKSNNK